MLVEHEMNNFPLYDTIENKITGFIGIGRKEAILSNTQKKIRKRFEESNIFRDEDKFYCILN